MGQYKLAVCAGHYLGTAGKRVPKELDKTQTREWVLNDRVVRAMEQAAKAYEGLEILRTDDPSGETYRSIKDRTKLANRWKATLYIDVHHNAGIHLGKGGGLVAICRKKDPESEAYRDLLYDAAVKAGNLKGNRSKPKYAKNLSTMVNSQMPAVIMECGFMDSKTDYPVISDPAYGEKIGKAMIDALAKHWGLKKKEKMYAVQTFCGSLAGAEKMVKKLHDAGFAAIVKEAV